MAKKVLITGGAGFIGFHLARQLKARGDHVVCIDNFNSYYDPLIKKERQSILAAIGIQTHTIDLVEKECIQELVKKEAISHICHLAAQAGVRHSIDAPNTYINANIQGFLNILEICRHAPHIPLTYASSSSVYGLNTKSPFVESDATEQPASLYGASKKANELMAHSYHHLFGIKATGLRFFTVYGPWGRPDMAYYKFTKAIASGLPIEIYNHGNMERDFTYIDDIVEGTMAAIDLESHYEIFNLGNNTPISLNTFILAIEEALQTPAKKNFLPMQPGDVTSTCADLTKSYQKLNYTPKVSLQEGIIRFVNWTQKNMHFLPRQSKL